jgi:hypothetical protein
MKKPPLNKQAINEIENLINIAGIYTINEAIKKYKDSKNLSDELLNNVESDTIVKNAYNQNIGNVGNVAKINSKKIKLEDIASVESCKVDLNVVTEARDRIMMGISRK